MKKILTIVLAFYTFAVGAQQGLNQLKFDDEKYFYHKAANQKSYRYTVDIKVASIEVISSDDRNIEKFRTQKVHTNNFGQGKPLSIVVIPLLYEVEQNGNSTLFKFGENAAEEDLNSAEVYVSRENAPKSNSNVGSFLSPPVKVDVSESDFYNYPVDEARNDEGFLMVEASRNETATIKINREERRGRVFVCVFNKRGNLLRALDPKAAGDETFTVDEPVFVIPVISRTPANGSTNNVTFEVGDPKEIAVVEIEEE